MSPTSCIRPTSSPVEDERVDLRPATVQASRLLTRSTIPDISDGELLRRFSAGGDAGARLFVRRFQSRVYGVAVRMLHDRTAAEDVAQEAFVRAWRKAATYDPARGSVAAWLLRITRNLAIDELRRRRLDVVDPDSLHTLADPRMVLDPADAAVTSATTARVMQVLAQLPAQQRRVLVLAAYWGRTTLEISQAEAIPLGTAKTRIRRGLIHVQAALTDADSSWAASHAGCEASHGALQ